MILGQEWRPQGKSSVNANLFLVSVSQKVANCDITLYNWQNERLYVRTLPGLVCCSNLRSYRYNQNNGLSRYERYLNSKEVLIRFDFLFAFVCYLFIFLFCESFHPKHGSKVIRTQGGY